MDSVKKNIYKVKGNDKDCGRQNALILPMKKKLASEFVLKARPFVSEQVISLTQRQYLEGMRSIRYKIIRSN
ncbi:uncharacterized protein N7500_004349 [Penicillium coprophilum]|uniref:uncharacterized protein n=1 Tax=Penicillium coprophilum TaxID=36646 RepID=UPI00238D654F|nr:uncharacterized protein N7500_010975 [Penicillium coprophilum]XP_056536020.1 uncharacterized protein N7500_004349 [Penicillium coprophilum]KAJ5150786.1 hypothetical protein N7500_010975 [Penicillium coprophilum]KAJ5171566.1 hypothetical protein N7500_004349 [Penicillium coprophilum]